MSPVGASNLVGQIATSSYTTKVLAKALAGTQAGELLSMVSAFSPQQLAEMVKLAPTAARYNLNLAKDAIKNFGRKKSRKQEPNAQKQQAGVIEDKNNTDNAANQVPTKAGNKTAQADNAAAEPQNNTSNTQSKQSPQNTRAPQQQAPSQDNNTQKTANPEGQDQHNNTDAAQQETPRPKDNGQNTPQTSAADTDTAAPTNQSAATPTQTQNEQANSNNSTTPHTTAGRTPQTPPQQHAVTQKPSRSGIGQLRQNKQTDKRKKGESPKQTAPDEQKKGRRGRKKKQRGKSKNKKEQKKKKIAPLSNVYITAGFLFLRDAVFWLFFWLDYIIPGALSILLAIASAPAILIFLVTQKKSFYRFLGEKVAPRWYTYAGLMTVSYGAVLVRISYEYGFWAKKQRKKKRSKTVKRK